MKIISYCKWREGRDWGFWFKVFGYGIAVSTLRLMFSERYGYKKYIKIGRVKIGFLNASKPTNGKTIKTN